MMMKKILILLVAALSIPALMAAQAQITTKKVKIEDFTEKVTKVVLSGNMFYDSTLKEAVREHWTISPYEFCSIEDFQEMKTDADYYFLIKVKGQFRKESVPGLAMLSLVQGGKGSDLSLDKMLEVVTVPICSADYPSGREITFMPALIDIVQNHVLASMERDYSAYGGLETNSTRLDAARSKRIVIADTDLSSEVDDAFLEALPGDRIEIVPEADADALLEAGVSNTLVSYTVSPYDAGPGSYCYKMLVDTQTHSLYYYRKHRISKNAGPGFLPEDISRIARR